MSLHRNIRTIKSATLRMAILLLATLAWSCSDDLFTDDTTTPHGETIVEIEASFEPFSSAKVGGAGAKGRHAGDIMSDLSDIALLAYDSEGNLMPGYPVALEFTANDITDENRTGADATTGETTESSTKCVKKSLKVSYGTYYLVAVANMGQYSDNGAVITSTTDALKAMPADNYATLDALRDMKRQWDSENIYNNRMMMGYFADKSDESSSAPSSTDDFTPVHVSRSGMTLRTWLRRAASKVTVDFDGTGLRENVKIYIRDVKVHDIPLDCTAGFGKKQVGEGQFRSFNNAVTKEEGLIRDDSQAIVFGEGAEYNTWPIISKGTPYIMDASGERAALHTNSSESLFFYENMQGNAPHGKGPVTDLSNGGIANSTTIKDEVPCGTYIEVRAFYVSEASGNISNGEIKYRFMLGKDADKNCDAERNHHYKVTLKFNGNANDYSWHVDYKEEPDSWDVPQPWYVSFLYGHQSTIPFKYTPEDGMEVVYFEAEIVKNPWEPDVNEGLPIPPDSQGAFDEPLNKEPGNGFLSLRYDNKVVVTTKDCGAEKWLGYDNKGDAVINTSRTLNNKYFYGEKESSTKINCSWRRINVDGTGDNTENLKPEEVYSYQRKGQSISVNLPLFTRPKVLIKETGYSGNNPYVGYTRTAEIEVTPYVRPIGSGEEAQPAKPKTINVQQVHRIVNPKGVYRKSGNFEPFHVRLLTLPGDGAENFQSFNSDGPWMAEIIGDDNFITLDGKQQVSGSTNTPIDFTIKFNRINNDNKVRNAVVRIKYNSYTCTHLIFVRQGYDPQAILPSAKDYNHQSGSATPVKWRTFNRISSDRDAEDPRDEGSLFKYGCSSQPIDAINNCYYDQAADGSFNGIGHYYKNPTNPWEGDPLANTAQGYVITQSDGNVNTGWSNRVKWTDIKKNDAGFSANGWENMATMRHFEQLYATDNVQFGYGVLYADGATETQENVDMAYGYYRRDPNRASKGMRGVFVYYFDSERPNDTYNGKNIFFPIGRSGYGHRKDGRNGNNGNSLTEGTVGIGILRYSCSGYNNRGWLFNKTAPLFAALYYRPGGIYYAKQKDSDYLNGTGNVGSVADDGIAYGMDLNYFSFDANMIGGVNLANGEDACMVRFVELDTPASPAKRKSKTRRR